MKTAFITGITGQDGSYLAEFLLEKGYTVHGLQRRSSVANLDRIEHLCQNNHIEQNRFQLHYGDVTDSTSLLHVIQKAQPDEIYNLAAMSDVKISFDNPEYTANTNGLGALRLLEAIRILGLQGKTKLYQASTSGLFGQVNEMPQRESTVFNPRSPYAIAKLFAYWMIINYREAYNIFACNGILFNHESPRRGDEFVSRKITKAVAQLALGKKDKLMIGNLDTKRDWGHAKDYVEAMWLMLQYEKPHDYVIASGVSTSIRDFIKMAFREIGVELEFKGSGINETGIVKECYGQYLFQKGQQVVSVDPLYFRPMETNVIAKDTSKKELFSTGDAAKAVQQLGWKPKYSVQNLIAEMVAFDISSLNNSQTFNKQFVVLPGLAAQ